MAKTYSNILEIIKAPKVSADTIYGQSGKIYLTKGDENPALLFGGTWELNENHLFLGWKIYERLS